MLADKHRPRPEATRSAWLSSSPWRCPARHVYVAEDLQDPEVKPGHPNVHPVAGVTAGVAQLLHPSDVITSKSEEQI